MKVKKRLYRDLDKGILGGVCAGISNYFDLDVTLIRIIWALLVIFFGTGILVYIIALFIIPPKPRDEDHVIEMVEEQEKRKLTRPKDNRILAGVCSGLSQYLKIDVSIIRIAFIILTLTYAVGALVYIILAVIIPEEKNRI